MLRDIDFDKWDRRLGHVEVACISLAIGILIGALLAWAT